jgi:DNA topoisomerase-1
VRDALDLLEAKQEGPRDLGHDPETGLEVLLQTGRYGPYVQLGPNPPKGAKRSEMPKRASVPDDVAMEDVTLEDALLWLSLPRTLGTHPDTGDEVLAATGRFGPYVKCGEETRSLADTDDVYTVELERALQLLAEPKSRSFRRQARSRVLRELGHSPDGKPIRVLEGRWGPYATDGETNASLPRGTTPEQISLAQALDLIGERAARPKRAGKTAAKRSAKKTTRKAAGKRRAKKS